jgi:2',3'-cyclic-nucleotide 2'-phosphodiesterase (5'-nucleotidase family)
MRKSFRLLCIAVFVFLSCFSLGLAQTAEQIELTVLHVNDLHGYVLPRKDKSIDDQALIGGAAYLARMIQDQTAKNPEGTLLLSAGDMFQGTPVSNVFRGQPVIDLMNLLQFDAMALGNHDFDWGQDILKSLSFSATFPFLSANIRDRQGLLPTGIGAYTLAMRKNLKIAIVGVTTPDTAYTTKPTHVRGLTFLDPVEMLPGVLAEVRDKGAALVIVLSHLGFDADQDLAQKVAGIDVIVGGHSHTAVVDPVAVGQTIIVQAGCYGTYLGVLQLRIEPETGRIMEYTGKNELKTVFAGAGDAKDDRIDSLINKYNDQIKAEFGRVVGETSVDLVRRRYGESNIGNLICDALRESINAEIAFQNGGGIRTDIATGKITMEQLFTLLPFDNISIAMDLTGRQILEVLEQSGTLQHEILQVSGMTVTYDLTRPPGARIVSATVGGKPLDAGAKYRVATNDFLAAGGDKFLIFKEGKNVIYGEPFKNLLVAYLQKHIPVNPRVENRIVMEN